MSSPGILKSLNGVRQRRCTKLFIFLIKSDSSLFHNNFNNWYGSWFSNKNTSLNRRNSSSTLAFSSSCSILSISKMDSDSRLSHYNCCHCSHLILTVWWIKRPIFFHQNKLKKSNLWLLKKNRKTLPLKLVRKTPRDGHREA